MSKLFTTCDYCDGVITEDEECMCPVARARIVQMKYNDAHRCTECDLRFDQHAALHNPQAPEGRCPGKDAKWPTSIRDEAKARVLYDKRIARMWAARSTIFTPR